MIFDERANVLAARNRVLVQHYRGAGVMEQLPDDLFEASFAVLSEAVQQLESNGGKASDIKGVGITNQRETTLVWSRRTGKPLYDAIVWPDTRNADTVRQLSQKSPKGIDALRDKTGLPLSTYFAGCKLRWLLDNVEDVQQAHESGELMFGTVDSWLLWNFTGGIDGGLHFTDVTNAARTMLMNLSTLQWDDDLLAFFEIDRRCLAKIVSNAEIYGKFAKGPLKGVPIAAMVGDQQAALIGQKCFQVGEAKNTYGTGCFMLYNTGNDIVPSTHGLLTTPAYKAGSHADTVYALEGSIAVAGSSIQWLRDRLCIIEEASQAGKLAETVEDTDGVYFVTGFGGLYAPYWDDTATGCMIGITASTDKSHIARATIEATCYQTKAILDAMVADAGCQLTALRTDGGMTNSDICMQIQADILGIDVDRPDMREMTALGSAIMAAVSLGLFGWDPLDPDTFKHVNSAEQTVFTPKWSSEKRDKRYAGWQRAVERSKGWKIGDTD